MFVILVMCKRSFLVSKYSLNTSAPDLYIEMYNPHDIYIKLI